jgi:ABC-type lipoprotein export system ATPase subunit
MGELEVRDLTVEFDSGGYRVRPLDNLSIDAEDGELVVLLGPSGCGKTTLLSCLSCLLKPTEGSIRFQGIEVEALSGAELSAYRQKTVGVVFQAFNLLASLSARKNVMVPMTLAGVGRKEATTRADALLERVALSERVTHRPGQMSGGQQQRVAIARALVHDPPARRGRRADRAPRSHPGRGDPGAVARAGRPGPDGHRVHPRRPDHPHRGPCHRAVAAVLDGRCRARGSGAGRRRGPLRTG